MTNGLPVVIEGVLTFVDAPRFMCFVQDSTCGVFVQGASQLGYRAGQQVRITGVARLGRFTPYVEFESLKVLGEAPLPSSRWIGSGEFLAGFYEGERVAIEGRVTRQERMGDRWRLRLWNNGEIMNVWVAAEELAPPPEFLNSRVRAHGICAGVFNERGEVIDFDLHVGTLKEIQHLTPPEAAGSGFREHSLGEMAVGWTEVGVERVRCRGWVTLHWPGRYLFITDGNDSLEVRTAQLESYLPGDEVEVEGFRTLAHRRMVLSEATLRKVGHRTPTLPELTTLERIRGRHSHGEVGSIEGDVVEVSVLNWEEGTPAGSTLLIRQGKGHLRLVLPPGERLRGVSRDWMGNHVRASGVLAAQHAPPGEPLTYRLLLQSPDNLKVLRYAPWWNVQRVVWAMGGSGIALVSLLGWGMGFSQWKRRMAEQSVRRLREMAIQHRDALLELTRLVQNTKGEPPLKAITEIVAKAFGETRVSIWRLNASKQALHCLELFDGSHHTSGQQLAGEQCRAYFTALDECRIIAADNALTDPRTREIAELYLEPEGIHSMLDVPIRHQGNAVGVLCIERVGLLRKWEIEEQDFAAAVGDQLALLWEAEERSRAERALREAHGELELRVMLRTTELAEARDRAEAADRLKSAFLATMSHELRTPLNSIIGFTGLLLQGLPGELNPEQKRQLGMVQNSARHLLSLINDVLDISKIESGQVDVHLSSFKIADVIQKVVGLAKPIALSKGLGLEYRIHSEVDQLLSDQRRLTQILINLVNNAIKFTDVGAVCVEVVPRDAFLEFKVSDTGIGIPANQLNRLFRPFQQLDSGLSRRHEGTGLGLAICAGLAKMLEGDILVESTHGKGSTFTLRLPIRGDKRGRSDN